MSANALKPSEPNNIITPTTENIVQSLTINWSSPEYNNWTCVNKSNLTYHILISIGYNVRICRGYNWTRDKGHSWLMIKTGPNEWKDFEPQTFEFKEIGHKYEFTNVYNEKELIKWY